MISQSAYADETHHSFDRCYYPAVEIHFLFGEFLLTEGARLIADKGEKTTFQTLGRPKLFSSFFSGSDVSGRSIVSLNDTLTPTSLLLFLRTMT